ncbi:photosystem II cytochrome c-550 [Synechococcus sp. PCC 7335]|uniref:photosystem II cytochrome c-550 n=1 Tax=Synechococcus sp. (strain ATCC 29403 / PCC 7335) TaxID=91464 RepID=UPI001D0D4665|nr:photosystem II cytochrome c-550 [Synechococcus sp. PCC 7335]
MGTMIHILKSILTKALSIYICLTIAILTFSVMQSAIASEIDPASRTVSLNETGEQVTFSTRQLMQGQRKFNGSCAQCHIDGASKTNPDVDLGLETLANATPARDSVEAIVDYLHDPTTYDGLRSLAELHPSTIRADLFPRMRDLGDDDLSAIAGYILAQPNIIGDQWAGGKPKR